MDHLVWNIDPEIVRWGSFAPRYYGLMFAIGFLVSYSIVLKIFLAEGKTEEQVSSLLLYTVVGTILGARLGHCIFYEPSVYLAKPWEILYIWKGGLASHGGTLGVMIAVWIYVKKNPDIKWIWLGDRVTMGAAFTGGCIRIGNFFNSEIVGKVSDVPWAIVFPRYGQQPRHPAMLYEAASYWLLFAFLMWYYKKLKGSFPSGRLLGIMLIWIFGSRILIEYTKINQVSFESGMFMNMGQLLSIPFVLAGAFLVSGKLENYLPGQKT
tara:strand:- start:231 stop:1028 length:798 start_codon:yes stop_codon:yes gene_type:complete